MQSLLKLIPVALIAKIAGTVAGYWLHKPAAKMAKACVVAETSVQKSRIRLSETHPSATSEADMESSWPSVTNF